MTVAEEVRTQPDMHLGPSQGRPNHQACLGPQTWSSKSQLKAPAIPTARVLSEED